MNRLLALLFLPVVSSAIPAPAAIPVSTLALTRPVPFELQTRTFRVNETVSVKLECTAIRQKFSTLSYTGAWIVDIDSGREIWRCNPVEGTLLGRSRILYTQESSMELPPGRYALHQFGGGHWRANSPFKDLDSVFNDLADMINREVPHKNPEKYHGKCMVTLLSRDRRAVFELLRDVPVSDCLIDLRRVEDDMIRTRTFRVAKRTVFQITAMGEADDAGNSLFDFGWLEIAGTGEPVWVMDDTHCLPAGGDPKNVLCVRSITLDPGFYTAGFVTDGSHAYLNWNAMPPTMPDWWGLGLVTAPGSVANVSFLEPDELDIPGLLVNFLRVQDDEKREAVFELDAETVLAIYAIGEGRPGQMYDYGWITDQDSGRRVWSMEWADCRHAGGTKRNMVFDRTITLPPGRYDAFYATDDSHSFGKWNSPAPDESFRYGMVIRKH